MTKRLTKQDPKSKEWRKAWRTFKLDPDIDDEEARQLKIEHHLGWRAGVDSVRKQLDDIIEPPHYYRDVSLDAWLHGARAGRKSAQDYIQRSGARPQSLR